MKKQTLSLIALLLLPASASFAAGIGVKTKVGIATAFAAFGLSAAHPIDAYQMHRLHQDPVRWDSEKMSLSESGRYLSDETFYAATMFASGEYLSHILEQIDAKGSSIVMGPKAQAGVWAIRTLLTEAHRRSGEDKLDPNAMVETAADGMFATAEQANLLVANATPEQLEALRSFSKTIFHESLMHRDVKVTVDRFWYQRFQFQNAPTQFIYYREMGGPRLSDTLAKIKVVAEVPAGRPSVDPVNMGY
jgi:hypothetical protein